VEKQAGTQVRFAVHGMHCEMCVKAITKALSERDGVLTQSVSLADSSAEVTFDATKVSSADLKAVIEDLGYTVAEKI
jgi:copper chaperone